MTYISEQIAGMVDMLPEQDQSLALELVKKLVLAWDPDFTKTTPTEKAAIDSAATEMETGDYLTDGELNWS